MAAAEAAAEVAAVAANDGLPPMDVPGAGQAIQEMGSARRWAGSTAKSCGGDSCPGASHTAVSHQWQQRHGSLSELS